MNKNFVAVGYRHDHENQTITLTKKFYKASSIVGTKEYNTLCRLRKDFSNYKIIVRTIEKNEDKKKSNLHLTYKNMRNYIISTHGEDSTEIATFESTIKLSKIKTGPYAFVKDWFLKTYPDARLN